MNNKNTPQKADNEALSEELFKKAAKDLEESKLNSTYKRIREKIERSIKLKPKQV